MTAVRAAALLSHTENPDLKYENLEFQYFGFKQQNE